MSTLRQPPPDKLLTWEAPPGHHLEWREEARDHARVIEAGDSKTCRRPGCRREAVWRLNRSRGGGELWWNYCDWHTYGRRIEGGKVLWLRAVEDEHPPGTFPPQCHSLAPGPPLDGWAHPDEPERLR